MLIKIFFNTDGFIGAWSHHTDWNGQGRISPITQGQINFAKKNNQPISAEMSAEEIGIFGRTINGRNGIEIVTENEDANFGNLKVKFNDNQNQKFVKETKKAHKYNKIHSDLESIIYT